MSDMAKGVIGLSVIVLLVGMLAIVIGVNFVTRGRLGFGAGPDRLSQTQQQTGPGAGTFLGIPYSDASDLAELETQQAERAVQFASEPTQAVLQALKATAPDLTAWAPHWLEWCEVASVPSRGEAGSEDFVSRLVESAEEWRLVQCGYSRASEWRTPDNGRGRWEFVVNAVNGDVMRCSASLSGGDPRHCFQR